MTILVVGANGATGRLLVQELLNRGCPVRAMVRDRVRLPATLRDDPRVTVIEAGILDLSQEALVEHVRGCSGMASCLGHNLSLKGILGPPYRLVTEATRRLCEAAERCAPSQPVRFALMNTAGNRAAGEPVGLAQACLLGLIRVLLPPHADNENAAALLVARYAPDHPCVQWVAVRPDTLLSTELADSYEVHAAPVRSALFDPGKTSRINVARFMATLLTSQDCWDQWKGCMPVIYDS